ncbi:MAG: hypothetical protein WAL99_13395 [Pseudonocardiaceae bacterium]
MGIPVQAPAAGALGREVGVDAGGLSGPPAQGAAGNFQGGVQRADVVEDQGGALPQQAAQSVHVGDLDVLTPTGCGGCQVGGGVQVCAVLQTSQLRVREAAAQDEGEQLARGEQPVAEAGVGHGPETELGAQGFWAGPAEGLLDLLDKLVVHGFRLPPAYAAWPWRAVGGGPPRR